MIGWCRIVLPRPVLPHSYFVPGGRPLGAEAAVANTDKRETGRVAAGGNENSLDLRAMPRAAHGVTWRDGAHWILRNGGGTKLKGVGAERMV